MALLKRQRSLAPALQPKAWLAQKQTHPYFLQVTSQTQWASLNLALLSFSRQQAARRAWPRRAWPPLAWPPRALALRALLHRFLAGSRAQIRFLLHPRKSWV